MPSNHLILYHPLLHLPSIFPSIMVFSNKSALRIRWPKYRNFNFSIRSSNEYSGMISFRMDWLYLLAVQRILNSLLQLTVQKHQFFSAQLSLISSSDAVPDCCNSGNVFALNHPHVLISGHTALRVCVIVTQSRPTVCNCMDCSLPGSSVHGLLQTRILG